MQNMARLCFTSFLLLSSATCLPSSESKVVPQTHRAAGVFMLIEGEKYTLNFTAARAACLFLNVSMATRADMERAVQHGLQTCKFGWIAEQVAVVPRLTSDKNCGQGKTGVVTWFARADKTFGVFCFNVSDVEETQKTSTASQQPSTSSTTLKAQTQASTPATPSVRSTTKSPPSTKKTTTAKSPEQTALTSTFALLVETTRSTRIFSSTSPSHKPFSTHVPVSVSHRMPSQPTVVSFTSSISGHVSNFSVSSESVLPQSVSSAKTSLAVVPTALIILGIILLLLTAVGVMCYYKRNIFSGWSRGQQKDEIETEMWKHADSEMDLHSQRGAEEDHDEEEPDRKYSSEITLCVNPDVKENSSE